MAAAGAETNTREDSGSRYTTSAVDIKAALQLFRNERTRVQLRFLDSNETLTAQVLDVDGKHLLLEDVKPRPQGGALTSGKPFALTARAPGVYLYAEDLRCLLTESERGVPFYVVTLPKQVLFQQRRRNVRVALPLRVKTEGAKATLITGQQRFSGTILDVSAGGCRVAIQGDISAELKLGARLTNCVLDIQDQLELESKATVRHTLFDPRRGITSCGIELTEMAVTDRRRLERFVESQRAKVNGPWASSQR